MASIYDVPTDQLIQKTAEELKKVEAIKPPVWAPYVKTGAHKERPPVQADWWYMRSASVLRKVAIMGPIGTSKLKAKYGGKKNRGMKAEKHYDGSGSIIRKVLQQLESAGLLAKEEKQVHKGRKLSPKGHSFIDKVASSLFVPRKKAPKQKAPKQKAPEAKAPIKASKEVPAKVPKEAPKEQPAEEAKE